MARVPTAQPEARAANRHEHKVLADVLARAFYDDPVMQWLIRDSRQRYARLKRFFRAELDVYDRKNRVLTTTDLSAVSMWSSPGNWQVAPLDVLRGSPRLLGAFRLRAVTGLRLLTEMEREHPKEHHWYLGIVGADPGRQGRGAGRAVITPVLDECDTEGIPAYLESSKPSNVPYYERFGFRVIKEIQVGDSPPIFPMWRDPA
jgi:GNAT superfamily N-acetyltransferase